MYHLFSFIKNSSVYEIVYLGDIVGDSGCFRRGNGNRPMRATPQEGGGYVKHYECNTMSDIPLDSFHDDPTCNNLLALRCLTTGSCSSRSSLHRNRLGNKSSVRCKDHPIAPRALCLQLTAGSTSPI